MSLLENLSVSDQLEVWSWCFGRTAELGRMITSPFRSDSHPSCNLKDFNGIVFFMDGSGRTGHGFTCLHGVAYLKNLYKDGRLNLNRAKNIVEYNLTFNRKPLLYEGTILSGFKRSITDEDTSIRFYPNGGLEGAGWTDKDIQYWSKRGIGSVQLENADRGGRVYSCSHYIINESVFMAKGLCYAYTINDKVKIYQPEAQKEYKWFSTVSQEDYWHTQRGCRKLFISKAQKDHLEAENLFQDYDVISFMNEKVVSSNFLEILDCYDEAVAVYDEDETGLSTLSMMRDYGVRTFVVDVPGCKDIDDVIVKSKQLKFKEIK